jgi:hypothetical protein
MKCFIFFTSILLLRTKVCDDLLKPLRAATHTKYLSDKNCVSVYSLKDTHTQRGSPRVQRTLSLSLIHCLNTHKESYLSLFDRYRHSLSLSLSLSLQFSQPLTLSLKQTLSSGE